MYELPTALRLNALHATENLSTYMHANWQVNLELDTSHQLLKTWPKVMFWTSIAAAVVAVAITSVPHRVPLASVLARCVHAQQPRRVPPGMHIEDGQQEVTDILKTNVRATKRLKATEHNLSGGLVY